MSQDVPGIKPRRLRPYADFEPGPVKRALLVGCGAILTLVTLLATVRSAAGLSSIQLSDLSVWVLIHLFTVLPAIPLGAWLFFTPKGTRLHRRMGKLWCALMFITAISTIFIRGMNDGAFSWIHIFTVLTLVGLPVAILRARKGLVRLHVRVLTGLYLGALVIAGGFAFFPGRVLWTMAFG